MSSILSEIKNTLETSSIKDTVMDMYHTMFNKLNDVKDMMIKKEEPEILPTIVKEAAPVKDEGYAPPAPAKPQTSKEIVKATLVNIKNYVWDYGYKIAKVIFYLLLASLVANDMIIYAAPIRAFFFIFTLIVTTTSIGAFFVAFYYLLRRGYDYYNQNLSSAKNKPPISFPMLFAILPLTTYYPTSPFVRFFLWAFMYQKSDKRMEKENKRLEIIMKNYWDNLNESFTYLEKIKETEPFSEFYTNIEKKLTIEGMHPIQKPKVEPMIMPEEKEKVQFFKPQSVEQAKAEAEEKIKKEEEKKEKEEEKKEKEVKPAPMPESIANQIRRKEEKKKEEEEKQSKPVPATVAPQPPFNPPPAIQAQPVKETQPPPAFNSVPIFNPPPFNPPRSLNPPGPAPPPFNPPPAIQAQPTQAPPSYNSSINGQTTPN